VWVDWIPVQSEDFVPRESAKLNSLFVPNCAHTTFSHGGRQGSKEKEEQAARVGAGGQEGRARIDEGRGGQACSVFPDWTGIPSKGSQAKEEQLLLQKRSAPRGRRRRRERERRTGRRETKDKGKRVEDYLSLQPMGSQTTEIKILSILQKNLLISQ
jgi:hypothetical protein